MGSYNRTTGANLVYFWQTRTCDVPSFSVPMLRHLFLFFSFLDGFFKAALDGRKVKRSRTKKIW